MSISKSKKLITFDRLLPDKGITDSRATLDRKEKMDPPQFPRRVRTSKGRIAWYDHEIDEHLANLERGNAENFRDKAKEKETAQ